MISREEAEAFTEGLGNIAKGTTQIILSAFRLGVPEALGKDLKTWVTEDLGGYAKLPVEERREQVLQLTAPIDEGGDGLSHREAAEVLGVDRKTIDRDLAGTNVPPQPPEEARLPEDDGTNVPITSAAAPDPERVPSDEPMSAEAEAEMVQTALAIAGDPDGRIARATLRASYSKAANKVRDGILSLDPEQLPEVFEAGHAADARRLIGELRDWCDRLDGALSAGLRLIAREG